MPPESKSSNLGRRAWTGFKGWPRWAKIAAPVVIFLLIAGALGSGSKKSDVSATATTAQTSATVASATSSTLSTTTTAAAITPVPTTSAPKALMPNVVCRNLQEAQDTIQRAGVFLSRSQDATGQGRHQILDKDWLVVQQSPSPGTPITENQPLLSVVKYGESNPCGL